MQDLAGVAHDDIDPSVFSISGDEQMVGKTINPLLECFKTFFENVHVKLYYEIATVNCLREKAF